ncbi:MAG TPA: hypothetical protein VFC67_22080 [Prolixibacteraceae bacterium]|nr:hypothetical protein [Prolixibacteraceae bacterium]
METTELKGKSFDDPDQKTRQIEKIKTDLINLRHVIDMIDFFIEQENIDRISAWLPDLKSAFVSIKKHTKPRH